MKYQEFYQEQMSAESFNETIEKIVQSETDKVRTKYSNEIKELQTKIPKDKTEEEIQLETRLKDLESKETEYKLKDKLSEMGLPLGLSKFLKGSDDLETYGKEFADVLNQYVLNSGYKPSSHKSTDTTITKEQFKKMSYSERERLYETNPELYKALTK